MDWISLFKGRIARQLIWATILFSSFITVITTGVQVYLDYKTEVSALDQQFNQIEASNLESLSQAVWVLDEEQILIQLSGLLSHIDTEYVAILVEDKTQWSVGTTFIRNEVEKLFPLQFTHRGELQQIGTLKVTASMTGIYRRLLNKIIVILISNFFKSLLVAFFLLLFFQRVVTRHLQHLGQFTRQLGGNLELPPLALQRAPLPPGQTDELEELVEAVNEMHSNLRITYGHLQESETYQRLLLEASDMGILGFNARGEVNFVNKAGATMLGYDEPFSLNRMRFSQVLHGDGPDGCATHGADCPLYQTFSSGQEVKAFHEPFWRADHTFFDAEIWSFPVWRNDQLVGSIVSFLDITERQRTIRKMQEANNELVRLDRLKTEFLSNVSHELRTPMASILPNVRNLRKLLEQPIKLAGMKESLMDYNQRYVPTADKPNELQTTEPPDVAFWKGMDFLLQSGLTITNAIESQGERLIRLINEILDMAKIESGRVEWIFKKIDLKAFLTTQHLLFSPAFEEKKLSLEVHYDPQLVLPVPAIFADEDRITQVLSNLISNSLKFTESGGMHMVVAPVVGTNGKYPLIPLFLLDTGRGIPSSHWESIFDRFGQVEDSMMGKPTGTGLGLPISRQIMDYHGGSLRIVDEAEMALYTEVKIENPGAIFMLQLPLYRYHWPIPRQPLISSNVSCLVIGQNVADLQVLYALLRGHLRKLSFAHNFEEAVQAKHREEHQLIIHALADAEMENNSTDFVLEGNNGNGVGIIQMRVNHLPDEMVTFKILSGLNTALNKPLSPGDLVKGLAQKLG